MIDDDSLMKPINKDALIKFIAEEHRNTYAAPKEIKDTAGI